MVKILLDHKEIDINATDISGDTALMKAAHRGQKKVIELLINHATVACEGKRRACMKITAAEI